jgi:DNA-directed RNA polymerase sigma subunit (sigma70/sigma32)
MRVNERERAVIRDRFGLAGSERTLRELGQTLGVSAERVRQIEQSALEKMRAACAEGGLEAPRGNRRTARRRGTPMRRHAARATYA